MGFRNIHHLHSFTWLTELTLLTLLKPLALLTFNTYEHTILFWLLGSSGLIKTEDLGTDNLKLRHTIHIMDYPSLFLQNDSIQKIFLDKMSSKQATNVTQSKYKCDICDYNTTKKELFRQHTLTKHSEVKHKCPNCAFTHYYSGKVRRHFQEVHLKKGRDKKTKDCFEKGCQNTQQEDCEKLGHNKHACKRCDYRVFTSPHKK